MPKPNRGGQRVGTSSNPTLSAYARQYAQSRNQQGQAAAQQPTPQPTPAPVPQPAPTPTPAQVAHGNIMPAGGTAFSTFETFTDDQKADVIKDALKSGTPMFLDNSGLQKFAYFTGMSDKPTVVTESQLKNVKGPDLWRSVRNAYKASADVGYSHNDIYDQLIKGDYTNYSDTGGSAYGKAIYFDTSKGSYGSGKGFTVIHAKFAPGAKTIDAGKLSSMYQTALARGDKLAVACSKADRESRENLYGLAKGYDAKIDKYGYRMIFNRRCLYVSDTTF